MKHYVGGIRRVPVTYNWRAVDDLASDSTSTPSFTGRPGPRLSPSFTTTSSPVQACFLMMTLYKLMLVDGTNEHANKIITTKEAARRVRDGGGGVPSTHRR